MEIARTETVIIAMDFLQRRDVPPVQNDALVFFWDVVYLYQCFPERVYGHFVLEDTLQCVIHLGHAAGHLVHGAPEVANGALHYASTED